MVGRQVRTVRTPLLDLAYEERGKPGASPVLLLHGWPDDVRTWDPVVEGLLAEGYRTIAPTLRGFGPTRFRDASIPRSGQLAALGQDVLDLIEALGLEDLTLVAHDWGARAAYIAAAVRPGCLRALITVSVGYGTGHPGQQISYAQARQYWYQWFFATDRGRATLEGDRRTLCRFLWATWSPSWRFTEPEFAATAPSWDNADWVEVTLHSYRHRWGNASGDPRYGELEARLAQLPPIRVPATVLHGAEDGATLPQTSAGKERFFTAGYERVIVPGAGHFIQREKPSVVVEAILRRARK